jgi:hypothetical protein
LANAHLFLDLNGDGVWEKGEYIVRTRSTGRYTFSDIPARSYQLRVLPFAGKTFPAGDVRNIKLAAGTLEGSPWNTLQPTPQY